MTNFEIAIAIFLEKQKHDKTVVSLEEVPRSPSTRFLHIKNESGECETYIIKVPHIGKMEPDESWIFHLENEIFGQSLLHNLGFPVKDYLLYDLNNDSERCFAISTYLPGLTFEEMGRRVLNVGATLMLDHLYYLHSLIPSTVYGYIAKRRLPFERLTVGEAETYFLRSDMARDNISLLDEEKNGLVYLMELFNRQQRFCLCHCDVTLRNSLWNKNNVYLIDWAFCHFTHPAHDVAHVIFWLCEEGLNELAEKEFLRAQQRYKKIGFQMGPIFTYYLAQRYIEFGRIRGEYYINQGKRLLANITNESFDPIQQVREFK